MGEWLPAGKAAKRIGITSETLRRRALKGQADRKWIEEEKRFLYLVDQPLVTVPQSSKTDGDGDGDGSGDGKRIGCYLPERDYYMISKDGRRRPQIVEGWVGRAILEVESAWDSIKDITVEPPARLPRLNIKGKEGGFSVVVGLTDFHFGKFGGAESGGFYNREVSRMSLMNRCENLINLVLKYGQPEEWIIPCGSDFFNCDDDHGRTSRGTYVDNDGTWQTIFTEGVQLFCDFVESLRCVAPKISLVFMPGNHDRTSSVALMEVLKGMYKDTEVRMLDGQTDRQYMMVGNSLLGFCHGDSVGIKDMPSVMSHEAKDMWSAKHKMVFTGHLHHERVIETKSGVTCYQMSSLAGLDRYHYRLGYTASKKQMTVYLIDHQDGCVGQLHAVEC